MSFFDFFKPPPQAKKEAILSKNEAIDSTFLEILKSQGEIWRTISSSKPERGLIICCPVACSIGSESIPKDYLLSHLLVPSKVPGEYLTLNNQTVNLSASHIICGRGFQESRKVKILSSGALSPVMWNLKSEVRWYVISRPLLGGLNQPESPDEISSSMMHKYVATLRSFPEIESIFSYINESIKHIKIKYDALLPSSAAASSSASEDDSFLISEYSALVVDVKLLWSTSSDRIMKSSTLTSTLGGKYPAKAKKQILQVIESFILAKMSDFLQPIIRKRYKTDNARISQRIRDRFSSFTQADLGLRCEFQAPQSEAISELATLGVALTCADKMLTLKRCVQFIRDAVDSNLARKFPLSSAEFATDDLILVVIWVLIRTDGLYSLVFTDLCYCLDFHFNASSVSEVGFNLCHFEVAMDWLFGAEGSPLALRETDGQGQLDSQKCESDAIVSIVDTCALDNAVYNAQLMDRNAAVVLVDESNVEKKASESVCKTIYSVSLSAIRSSFNMTQRQKQGQSQSFSGMEGEVDSTSIASSGLMASESHLVDSDSGSNKPRAVRALVGGDGYLAALSAEGTAFTWGQPDCGRLGRGPSCELDLFLPVDRPTKIMELGGDVRISKLACGKSHMLAVTSAGLLFGWGDNRCGQLGLFPYGSGSGSGLGLGEVQMVQAASPMLIESLSKVRTIDAACGAFHSLALDQAGQVYSWGRATGGRLGQTGDKSNMAENMMGRPTLIRSSLFRCPPRRTLHKAVLPFPPRLEKGVEDEEAGKEMEKALMPRMVSVVAGYDYSLAVGEGGEVFSWGSGTYGALGHGEHCDQYLPKLIQALHFSGHRIVAAAASHHSLFLSSSGAIFGCGLNNRGQVGSLPFASSPKSSKTDLVSVLAPRPVVYSLAGSSESATKENDSLKNCQLFKSISCGEFHSAAVTTEGHLIVWGEGQAGQDSDQTKINVSMLLGDKGSVQLVASSADKIVFCGSS